MVIFYNIKVGSSTVTMNARHDSTGEVVSCYFFTDKNNYNYAISSCSENSRIDFKRGIGNLKCIYNEKKVLPQEVELAWG